MTGNSIRYLPRGLLEQELKSSTMEQAPGLVRTRGNVAASKCHTNVMYPLEDACHEFGKDGTCLTMPYHICDPSAICCVCVCVCVSVLAEVEPGLYILNAMTDKVWQVCNFDIFVLPMGCTR